VRFQVAQVIAFRLKEGKLFSTAGGPDFAA
jgi:hypothetical protein